MTLPPPFRLATPDDAPTLARFIAWASHGMAEHVWRTAAGAERAFTYGTERMAKRAAAGEWIVADPHVGAKTRPQTGSIADPISGPVAGLSGYPIAATPDPVPPDMEPMFVPLQELENAAPASWYVHVLAALPEERGKGWGTRLLALAEEIARQEGLPRMSIIVADSNDGARRLYARAGFRQSASRPMVKGAWQARGETWLLLTREL